MLTTIAHCPEPVPLRVEIEETAHADQATLVYSYGDRRIGAVAGHAEDAATLAALGALDGARAVQMRMHSGAGGRWACRIFALVPLADPARVPILSWTAGRQDPTDLSTLRLLLAMFEAPARRSESPLRAASRILSERLFGVDGPSAEEIAIDTLIAGARRS